MFTIREESPDLTASGALVAVRLGAPRTVKSDLGQIDTLAEIDTSFVITRIQEGVATSLGLTPTGTVCITSSTALAYEAHLYNIRLVFPQNNLVFEVQAIEVPYMVRQHARIKCLIGRDILQHTVLTYNGRDKVFTLEFRG
jgi:hypothetical protein